MPDPTAAAIARDLANLAGYIADILADSNIQLTSNQTTTLNNFSSQLTNYSDEIANRDALAALNAAAAQLNNIAQATSAANAAALSLKTQAARLNSILAILGDAVSLGAAIVTGNLPGAIGAANSLATDAQHA
jgi:hypothetical protein